MRDALGYEPWFAPARPFVAAPAQPEEAPWTTRLARQALAIRHTPLGRALYRMAPRPLVQALKARLHA
jgi:hypothetical protein